MKKKPKSVLLSLSTMENNINSLKSISRENDATIISICKILGKPVAYNVLVSLMSGPKTGEDISIEKRLPRSSTYKAIRQLQKAGLVFISSYKDQEKEKIALYRSRVEGILISVSKEGGNLTTTSKA